MLGIMLLICVDKLAVFKNTNLKNDIEPCFVLFRIGSFNRCEAAKLANFPSTN